MLRSTIEHRRPEYLTTYTRNPAILKMLLAQCSDVYPLHQDDNLKNIAARMPRATMLDAAYHIHRYDEGGLFTGDDPAERPINGIPLQDRFVELTDIRNALVVAARVRKELL